MNLFNIEKAAFDRRQRTTLRYNIGQFEQKFAAMQTQFTDIETVRRVAKNLRWAAIEQLDKHLLDWERAFRARGGEVIWAADAHEARHAVAQIAQHYNAKKVVKSKSMVTEEINLNEHLEDIGVDVLETDLGEYLAQLAGEAPFHVTAPILQKSKEDVAKLLHQKFGTPSNWKPDEVMAFVRDKLRFEYEKADIGITGGNFLVAETGSVVVVENEGNARLTAAMPRVHVAIVGIEKIVRTMSELPILLPILATHSTGQRVATYNTIFNGPRQKHETDGPEAMYVILLDNGRTNALANPRTREILYCIRCGACQNVCPVYRTIGGHAYQTTYSGPIGAILEPMTQGYERQGHLAQASSLCGKCTAVCPVKIDIHNLLLYHRQKQADSPTTIKTTSKNNLPTISAEAWQQWQRAMLHRWTLNAMPILLKNWAFTRFFKDSWGKRHEMPQFPPKSFNELWKEGKV